MATLDGAKIKLARACRHIHELEASAQSYLAAEPFVFEHTESSNRDIWWRVRIRQPVPIEWSAIIGDAVHNLRTALDLLAWQLVEVGGGQPSKDTHFPITNTGAHKFHATIQRALNGAPVNAIRFIRRLKPYAEGNKILAQLHALDITDKHRLLFIVGMAHTGIVMKTKMNVPWSDTPIDFLPIPLRLLNPQFPLYDGATVLHICAAARDTEAAKTEISGVFELAFGDIEEVKGLALIATLHSLSRHVARIITIADNHFFNNA